MEVNPQDENGIVLMILRDTYKILSSESNFNFNIKGQVKLQKIFFLLADGLKIPLTRSWYQHGPFIHNRNINFQRLRLIDSTLSEKDKAEIARAEKLFRDVDSRYHKLLKSIVPRLFYMQLDELLAQIYNQYAPERYKPSYLSNLAIDSRFSYIEHRLNEDEGGYSIQIQSFTKYFLELASYIAGFDDVEPLYEYTDQFISTLESCFLKMNKIGATSIAHLNLLKNAYEGIIWTPLTLKISENTMEGPNADELRVSQKVRFLSEAMQLRNRINYLNEILRKDDMLASVAERTAFFQQTYGNDKEFLNATGNVWKSYK